MAVKYLQRKKAAACPIHQTVMERASESLSQHGYFEKNLIVKDLNYDAIADAIRWDYVREFLENGYGIELIPLAERFFKHHKPSDEEIMPEKYIAMGNGKKTKGYAQVEYNGGHLAIRVLEHKKALLNGVGKKYNEYLDAVQAKNLITSDEGTKKLEKDIS